ncbi:MAG: phosphate regulon transcriptional regulator PhoB [Snodgrassella sp.]|uniref:phosphate regulon transcriptional regulator PhoB n=1 Tax=Snodgrassella sp. TaxID=2815304 RepID=UPI002583F614|nr:phosphate regulon transcriptional regulator PhoB [Snodgrassella sp.]MCO6523367.1 phosphate regulon transcriptional regulator PhoB [Snodgrassella sp.]
MAEVMILVVEDEDAISTLIQFTLEQAGFTVQSISSVEKALPLLQSQLPDVILLDWMLPGISGLQFIKYLRDTDRTRDLPIILLTARGEETDKEQGLNLGADDYITKPFSPRELVARINALLRRRAPQKTSTPLHVHDLELNPQQQRVQVNGQIIALGPSEFKLLHFFMTHPDRIYTRRQLLDLVWGDHVFIEERTVDVHIRRLRRGLETVGYDYLIQTVRGSGYRFACNQE